MADDNSGRGRIDQELVGEPIRVGGRTIRPVARLAGRYGSGGDQRSSGFGAALRVRPVEVIVTEADGSEHSVPIVDISGQALRGIITVGLLVASVCILLLVIKEAMSRKVAFRPIKVR